MQSIFKRYEKKYVITKEQGDVLQELIARYMSVDRDGEYLVQNLYYDTANWDVIRESIEKPLYKEKLRLRFYNNYNPLSQGFLELKKKYDNVVYKRRIAFSLGEIKTRCIREIVTEHAVLAAHAANDSQISKEIKFFLQNKNVSEKIFIVYKRTAYNSINADNLRISFDRDIFFNLNAPVLTQRLAAEGTDFSHDKSCQILDKNHLVMEIKTSGAVPLWLSHALSENKIFPVSFSKYGACFVNHILKRQDIKEAGNAA